MAGPGSGDAEPRMMPSPDIDLAAAHARIAASDRVERAASRRPAMSCLPERISRKETARPATGTALVTGALPIPGKSVTRVGATAARRAGSILS